MGYIYKITNDINGKVYIGKTESTIMDRWKNHVHDWKNIDTQNRPLYKAFTKYGIEHFHIERLEFQPTSEMLCEREQYWINYYRSYIRFPDCNGYNTTLGGDGKTYFNHTDEEVIQKYQELKTIRATAKYFQCDFDTISNRLHRNGIDPNSLSSKRKIHGKKVARIVDGKIIDIFNSQTEAAEWLIQNNYANGEVNSVATNIGRCCNGKRKSCGGFSWQRIEDGGLL